MAMSVALALVLGSSAHLQVASAEVASIKTESTVLTQVNPADQVSVDLVLAQKTSYESLLASYVAAPTGSKESKKAYKKALKAWQKLKATQAKAKKQISKTFRLTVADAKRVCATAVRAATTVSEKAEARAAKNAAIAAASVARNDALNLIRFDLQKPAKPAK